MSIAYELIGDVLLVIAGIIPIANPFSTAPVFTTMTSGFDQHARHRTAKLACIYMAVMLIVFFFAGVIILQFFGISLQALRIAGGLIIAYMGFRMLFPTEGPAETEGTLATNPQSVAFVPLALPMLSGPGSITVVISMATEVAQGNESITRRLLDYAVVGLGIVLSAFICWLVLHSAGRVVRFLGETGILALTRIMGFLLVCIGCQFVLSSFEL